MLKCKICAQEVKLATRKGLAADSLFEILNIDLAKELKEKYATAINLYEGKLNRTRFIFHFKLYCSYFKYFQIDNRLI